MEVYTELAKLTRGSFKKTDVSARSCPDICTVGRRVNFQTCSCRVKGKRLAS